MCLACNELDTNKWVTSYKLSLGGANFSTDFVFNSLFKATIERRNITATPPSAFAEFLVSSYIFYAYHFLIAFIYLFIFNNKQTK